MRETAVFSMGSFDVRRKGTSPRELPLIIGSSMDNRELHVPETTEANICKLPSIV